jgi:catechol 2,3-dioxygenase-like lactoylglutathione lyase family enzyme
MSRVQLALRVADLEGSVAFYSKLFGAEPAKRRPGYANFAIAEPPLKLVLIEGTPGEPTRMDHLGVEVETTGEVTAPGDEPWEVYVVKGDADVLDKPAAPSAASVCC